MARNLGKALVGLKKAGVAPAKKLGTPRTSMWIEPKAPVKPAAPKAVKDTTPLLNAPNTYDKNTYTPDMFPVKPVPTLTKT